MIKQAKNLYKNIKKNKNILIFLHLNDCHWCNFVTDEVIDPMAQMLEYTNKLIIRRVKINAGKTLINFNNQNITNNKFAFNYDINFYPTILFFNQKGKLLKKIIGVANKDFYWTDLDKIIEKYDI